MKRLFLPFCCLVAVCLAGCGIKIASNQSITGNGSSTIHPSGNEVTETRKAADFSGISAVSGINVIVIQSDSLKTVVTADENVIRFVLTEVRDGILCIHYADDVSISGPAQTQVKVWCPRIESLTASSNASISLNGVAEGAALEANASSGGMIRGTVNYQEVTVLASSNARIDFSGKCTTYQAEVSSGAKAAAAKLLSDMVYVSVSSNADATVYANSYLQAKAWSGGSVIYYGDPSETDKKVSSNGSIKAAKNR